MGDRIPSVQSFWKRDNTNWKSAYQSKISHESYTKTGTTSGNISDQTDSKSWNDWIRMSWLGTQLTSSDGPRGESKIPFLLIISQVPFYLDAFIWFVLTRWNFFSMITFNVSLAIVVEIVSSILGFVDEELLSGAGESFYRRMRLIFYCELQWDHWKWLR